MSRAPKQSELCWQVTGDEAGMKLLPFLQSKLKESISNRDLKRKIESNLCTVNGKSERFASVTLKKKDLVTFFDQPLEKKTDVSFDRQRILFDDEAFIIYNKPAGLVCDSKILETLIPGQKLFLTHRLDKETSGVLILAKNRSASSLMAELFKQRLVHKTYLTWVDGVLPKSYGKIENYLGKIKTYQGNAIYGEVSKEGQLAITKWRVQKRRKTASLLECSPLTGRTHQIRVHLNGIGYPILGDYVYGRQFTTLFRPKRVLLHALKIEFTHPMTRKKVLVSAPIPRDFSEAEKYL